MTYLVKFYLLIKLLKEKSEIEKLCKELEAENKKLKAESGEIGAKHKNKK